MNGKQRLQDLLGVTDGYLCLNREERNYAALLYHLLLKGDNLGRFLECLDRPELTAASINNEDVQLYFEYAYLRDLWWSLDGRDVANDAYRKTILALLPTNKEQEKYLKELEIEKFNKFFGASPRASRSYIQMPGRWSDTKFKDWSDWGGREFAEQACMLKWAFNAKPDLVIHISRANVICIEAKVESSEGIYKVESRHGPFRMTQTQIQQFILSDLLGFTTQFVYLTKNDPRASEGQSAVRNGVQRTWKTVFDALDLSHELPFVAKFLQSTIIQPRAIKR